MLSPESQVSPEAQQFLSGRRKCCIMILKDKTRKLVWDRVPLQNECETYIERDLSQAQHDAIMDIQHGALDKIEALLSKYY